MEGNNVRVSMVLTLRSESRFVLVQPFVVSAAYDREEPKLTLFCIATKGRFWKIQSGLQLRSTYATAVKFLQQ
jgi:hypothetical protein